MRLVTETDTHEIYEEFGNIFQLPKRAPKVGNVTQEQPQAAPDLDLLPVFWELVRVHNPGCTWGLSESQIDTPNKSTPTP